MAKFKNIIFLRNQKGQSMVEYILLLVVLSSIGFTFYNNRKFKEFIAGNSGLFMKLRQGMQYSYRYGRELNPEVSFDEATEFNYVTNKHDTYYDRRTGKSRFFAGVSEYGKMDEGQ